LLVEESGVRLGASVEDADPFQRDAVVEIADHLPDDGAHLVVGVADRDDVIRRGHRDRDGWKGDPEAGDEGPGCCVGPGVSGHPDDAGHRRQLGHAQQESGRGPTQILGEVEDHTAQLADVARRAAHDPGGRSHEIELVVPPVRESPVDQTMDADDVASSP
jgi:hypothetical protein